MNGIYRRFLSLLLVTIAFLIVLAGCNTGSKGLENGLISPPKESPPSPGRFCAYRSDKTRFDLNNVTLEFFYGSVCYPSVEAELQQNSYPEFSLYFEDKEDKKILIKHVEENFISEKYRCELTYDDEGRSEKRVFNHSEMITIPKEIFTNSSGEILFVVFGHEDSSGDPAKIDRLTSISIYYKVMGDEVILSAEPID